MTRTATAPCLRAWAIGVLLNCAPETTSFRSVSPTLTEPMRTGMVESAVRWLVPTTGGSARGATAIALRSQVERSL